MVTGNEIPGEELPEQNESQELEVDPQQSVEDRARQAGWMPYEEWIDSGNNPDDWVGAEAFLVKGEFIQKLKKQSRKIEEMESVINELAEHNKKVAEQQYKKAYEQLKQEKAEALNEGDTDRVVDIDERMKQAEQQYQQKIAQEQKKQASQSPVNNEFQEWVERPENQWYTEDPVLKRQADALADEYVQQNPNASFQDIVKNVESQLQQELPERFGKWKNPNKSQQAPAVNPTTNSASTSSGKRSRKKVSSKDLTEEQKQIANKFVRQGVFNNADEYAQQLYEIGEIGG